MLATTYPGGAGAMFAGMLWLVVSSCSALVAIVALALSPFTRTAPVACTLSQVALWGGLVAVVFAVIGTVFVAIDRDVEFGSPAYQDRLLQSLLPALVAALVPVAAVAARFWSYRTEKSKSIKN